MAWRNYGKKKYRKRKRSKMNSGVLVNISGSPVPAKSIVKFRYCDGTYIDPNLTGAPAGTVYRANGMNDPDQTGVGHQPLGFDQWMTFYNHYTVLGAKITATFTSVGTTAINTNAFVALDLRDVTTYTSNPNTLRENPNIKWKYITYQQPKAVITKYFSAKKFFGVKDVEDGIYRGTAGADPVEQALFQCLAASVPGSGDDPARINVSVVIEYIAALTERQQIAGS